MVPADVEAVMLTSIYTISKGDLYWNGKEWGKEKVALFGEQARNLTQAKEAAEDSKLAEVTYYRTEYVETISLEKMIDLFS